MSSFMWVCVLPVKLHGLKKCNRISVSSTAEFFVTIREDFFQHRIYVEFQHVILYDGFSVDKFIIKMDEAEIVYVGALHLLCYQQDMFRTERCWSTHPFLVNRLTGQFHIMFDNHRKYLDKFFQYFRMSVTTFMNYSFLLLKGSS